MKLISHFTLWTRSSSPTKQFSVDIKELDETIFLTCQQKNRQIRRNTEECQACMKVNRSSEFVGLLYIIKIARLHHLQRQFSHNFHSNSRSNLKFVMLTLNIDRLNMFQTFGKRTENRTMMISARKKNHNDWV